MLPLDVDLRSFNRINWPNSPSGSNLPDIRNATGQQTTRHFRPFHMLLTLVSRAKPHFVICDAAAKLSKLESWLDFTAKVQSLWPGRKFSAFSMLNSIQSAYRTWLASKVPSTFASTRRVLVPIAPLHPYLTATKRLHPSSIPCSGPCVRSRFVWMPNYCARYRGDIIDSTDDLNLVYYDDDENLDTCDLSGRMAQY